MLIAVDVDEVLAEYNSSYSLFCGNEICSPEESIDVDDSFFFFVFFSKIKTVKGSEEGLRDIKNGNETIIMTSRPIKWWGKTREFINKNFGQEVQIFFSGEIYGQGKGKPELCSELGVDILIDDKKLVTENLVGKWNKDDFVDVRYPLPEEMLKDKKQLTISFKPHPGNFAGGIYDLRILKAR